MNKAFANAFTCVLIALLSLLAMAQTHGSKQWDWSLGNGSAASGARTYQELPKPDSAAYRAHHHWGGKSTD